MGILEQFGIRSHIWRLALVQSHYELRQIFLSNFWSQNVVIPPAPKKTPEDKCVITFKLYTTTKEAQVMTSGNTGFVKKSSNNDLSISELLLSCHFEGWN